MRHEGISGTAATTAEDALPLSAVAALSTRATLAVGERTSAAPSLDEDGGSKDDLRLERRRVLLSPILSCKVKSKVALARVALFESDSARITEEDLSGFCFS
jgi:hypothetical protein